MRNIQLIIFLSLLVLACGVMKKEVREQKREAGRMEVLRGDSLWMEQLERWGAKRKVEMWRMEFMKPDSADRQFVHSVTVVSSEEEACGEASSSLSAETETQACAEMEAEASHEEQSVAETRRGALFWGVWAVGLMVVLVCIVKVRAYRDTS
jgi:hypothetical protein